MTDKRFIIIGDENLEFIMQDKLLLPIYGGKERLSLKTCCDLLNDLYEENHLLKQKIKELQGKASSWKITASEQIMEQSELVRANVKLKSELLDIEEDRDYFKAKAGSLEEGYLQLQDREIRLKEELDYWKKRALLLEKKYDEEDSIKWLRENTVWEQMPSNKRTFTKTTKGDIE